ncbi:MAG: tetratricopeptide repeat protein [Pseudomonadota bacterium]
MSSSTPHKETAMLRKALIVPMLLLTGCGLVSKNTTIGKLNTDDAPLDDVPLPRVSHKDVRDDYRSLLEIVEDRELREQIERRIAGVYMLEGDYRQLIDVNPPEGGYFAPAIKSYNEVISKYPGDPDNAESLYQLAKAYDLDGKDILALSTLDTFIEQYPVSPHLGEAYFRKGDIHFGDGQYEKAVVAYQSVITLGVESAFLNNSYYLLGWSRYKLGDYDGGLASFSEVLDRLVPGDGKIERLDKVERSLVDDTLRIMSLSLAYGGGSEKINNFYADRPQSKKYTWLLYSGLGKHFLEKERYEDSAGSYRAFVLQNPTSDRAPEMHSEMIRAYIDGEFSSQVLPEKERYVQNYGIHSEFWKTKGGDVKAKVIPNLKTYIDELARHYHGTGQKLKKQLPDSDADSDKLATLALKERDSFLKAAEYYRQFMETFPEDPQVQEMTYMRAEALFDGGDYVAAIEGYEKTAYHHGQGKYGADAGYAAIIAFHKHAEDLQKAHGEDSPQLSEWRARTVDSQLKFVNTYRGDKRSGAVLAKASEELFALKRYEKALEVATSVISRTGDIDSKLHKTAYGVIAHSQYELGNYAEAESGYQNQLKYIPRGDKEYEVVLERVATTAYKQGDAALQANDLNQAIEHFLRIKTIAPMSSARVAAQYDAATHMMTLEQWKPALVELLELRSKFPDHELGKTVAQKIAYAYEQDEQWKMAAGEYMTIYRNDADENARRDALFIAAGLYEKAGEYSIAIDHFKRWAHAYEEPFDNRMEARYHLAHLYKKTEDMTRHLYWLRRVIDGDSKAGSRSTDRSRWLAAWANAEYGDYWRWEFKRVKLRMPLEKWMPRKSEKLKNAMQRYEESAGYGIFEFSARASYSIGELYASFARELMDSPRPKGLSTTELQQYELLLEEQAIPFEELAIEIHENNIRQSWDGNFNHWVDKSFAAMAKLSPARFDKQEMQVSYGYGIK